MRCSNPRHSSVKDSNSAPKAIVPSALDAGRVVVAVGVAAVAVAKASQPVAQLPVSPSCRAMRGGLG